MKPVFYLATFLICFVVALIHDEPSFFGWLGLIGAIISMFLLAYSVAELIDNDQQK
jgi:amino acid transporter